MILLGISTNFLNKNDQVSSDVLSSAKKFMTSTLTDVLGIVIFNERNEEDSKEDELVNLLIELKNQSKIG